MYIPEWTVKAGLCQCVVLTVLLPGGLLQRKVTYVTQKAVLLLRQNRSEGQQRFGPVPVVVAGSAANKHFPRSPNGCGKKTAPVFFTQQSYPLLQYFYANISLSFS